jgi:cysteine desulfurase
MAQINLSDAKPCAHALDLMRMDLSAEQAAQWIYDLAGADKGAKFLFTSSGAEAVATVHWTAFLELARKEGKCHFITTGVEEAHLLQSLKRLEELGCFVKIAPLKPNGQVDVEKLATLINPRTAMISLSLAHGLTGVIQPIEEIAALAKEKGVLLHVDATYAMGKVIHPFAHVDYLTFAGDRIHATTSGAVFSKGPLIPIIPGKAEMDLPALIALGAACSEASLHLDTMSLEVARLRNKLDFNPHFQDSPRLPNIAVLSFPGVHQEMLQYTIQRKGLLATLGGTRLPKLHQHLLACGIDDPTALSFTLSRFTTEEEIDRANNILRESTAALRPLAEALV